MDGWMDLDHLEESVPVRASRARLPLPKRCGGRRLVAEWCCVRMACRSLRVACVRSLLCARLSSRVWYRLAGASHMGHTSHIRTRKSFSKRDGDESEHSKPGGGNTPEA